MGKTVNRRLKDGDLRHVLVISDLHIPYEHPDALKFCKAVEKLFRCNSVVFIGDVAEFSKVSYHEIDPDTPFSPSDELKETRERLKEWGKEFPLAKIMLGNHECYSEDTQVLTDKGWKYFPELSKKEKVYSMGVDGASGSWEEIDEIVSYDYSGEMYEIFTSRSNQLVTPNHKVYYKTSGGNVKVKEARMLHKNFDLVTSPHIPERKGVRMSDEEIRLEGWAVTDSHFTNYRGMVLYQSGEYVGEIRSLLETLDIPFTERSRDRKIEQICGRKLKSCKRAYEFYFPKDAVKTCSNKILPDFVKDMSDRQFEIYLETLIKADGTFYNKVPGRETAKSLVFYGAQRICEDLQIELITRGYSATIQEYRKGQFRVNIVKRQTSRCEKTRVVNYSGKVWCLQTRLGNFVTRRKGKPVVSGNSRIHRKARTAGIPGEAIKDMNSILGTPDTWKWVDRTVIDKVLYNHGIGYGGMYGARRSALDAQHNVVMGHSHQNLLISFINSKLGSPVFGMDVSCLIDPTSEAFKYAKHYHRGVNLGCGVVLGNGRFPIVIPMYVDENNKWTGELPEFPRLR